MSKKKKSGYLVWSAMESPPLFCCLGEEKLGSRRQQQDLDWDSEATDQRDLAPFSRNRELLTVWERAATVLSQLHTTETPRAFQMEGKKTPSSVYTMWEAPQFQKIVSVSEDPAKAVLG